MKLLTIDEIVFLHKKIIDKTGGSHNIRDMGLLESAVSSIYTGIGDNEKYPTIPEKSARLAFALIKNHAFLDGNKRIGVIVMLATLKMNGYKIGYTQRELIEFALKVAAGKLPYEGILNWILNRLEH